MILGREEPSQSLAELDSRSLEGEAIGGKQRCVADYFGRRISRRNRLVERPTSHDGHEKSQAISHSVSGGTA
ncbi:hypothetical protein OAF50_03860 [bacterium]|nr:hypothetical protein [bacterium]